MESSSAQLWQLHEDVKVMVQNLIGITALLVDLDPKSTSLLDH